MICLGLDTSNYACSAALYNSESGQVLKHRIMLPVEKGGRGLRQSDAVFHHVRLLPSVLEQVLKGAPKVQAVCASSAPLSGIDSYMPCFKVGQSAAKSVGYALGVPVFETTHQHGHIAAALYSCKKTELFQESFIAFHLSGGTTQAVLAEPDDSEIFSCTPIAKSLDLNAGQAIDRLGVSLGLDFPAGAMLEQLALKGKIAKLPRPRIFGCDCSLSGVENKCAAMLKSGESAENTALFCLEYIAAVVCEMTQAVKRMYPSHRLVYTGGVMSNSIIRKRICERFEADFALPDFSCDNAAGVAVLGYMKARAANKEL